jgi:hypothetical protein
MNKATGQLWRAKRGRRVAHPAGHFDGILAIAQEPFGIAQKVPGPPKG